jgi:hypothetical protein
VAAFWAVLTFGGSGPALTVHDLLPPPEQEIQIQTERICERILTKFGVEHIHLSSTFRP